MIVRTTYAGGEHYIKISWVLLPGFYVGSKAFLFIAYALTLFYLFLGIAIISDVFMG